MDDYNYKLLRDKYYSNRPLNVGAEVPEEENRVPAMEPSMEETSAGVTDEDVIQAEIDADNMAQEEMPELELPEPTEEIDAGIPKDEAADFNREMLMERAGEYASEPPVEEAPKDKGKDKLQELLDRVNSRKNKKEEGFDWAGRLPDMLAAAHNIDSYARGVTGRKELAIDNYNKAQDRKRKNRQGDMLEASNLLKLQKQMKEFENPNYGKKDFSAGGTRYTWKDGKPVPLAVDLTAEGSAFTKKTQELQAKRYDDDLKKLESASNNAQTIDQTVDATIDVINNSGIPLGTGEILTLGATTGLALDEDKQRMESLINQINIKEMVSTFEGMSRAVDSETDRAAWDKTMPKLTSSADVTLDILLRLKSRGIKFKHLMEEKQKYLSDPKNTSLKGFDDSTIRNSTVIYDQRGKPFLIPDSKKGKYIKTTGKNKNKRETGPYYTEKGLATLIAQNSANVQYEGGRSAKSVYDIALEKELVKNVKLYLQKTGKEQVTPEEYNAIKEQVEAKLKPKYK